ncbi:MAG TPA: sigma factor [Phycisphaerales bacterium]|nr:sigma factor [Phycisphaerales bacterium]
MSAQIDPASLAFAQRLARIKARQLRPLLPRESVDDVEQELLLEVITAWERYDPAKGHPEPFIERVVQQRAWKVLRDPRYGGGGRKAEQAFQLGEHDRPATSDDTEGACLVEDVNAAVRKLPAPMQEVCEQLRHERVSAVARAEGVPRSTLDYWLGKVRAAFTDAALDQYVS